MRIKRRGREFPLAAGKLLATPCCSSGSHQVMCSSWNYRLAIVTLQFVFHHLANLIITQVSAEETAVQEKTRRTLETQLLSFVLGRLNRSSLFSGVQTFIKSRCFQSELAGSRFQLRHFK